MTIYTVYFTPSQNPETSFKPLFVKFMYVLYLIPFSLIAYSNLSVLAGKMVFTRQIVGRVSKNKGCTLSGQSPKKFPNISFGTLIFLLCTKT
jgi:hypothetical protein